MACIPWSFDNLRSFVKKKENENKQMHAKHSGSCSTYVILHRYYYVREAFSFLYLAQEKEIPNLVNIGAYFVISLALSWAVMS